MRITEGQNEPAHPLKNLVRNVKRASTPPLTRTVCRGHRILVRGRFGFNLSCPAKPTTYQSGWPLIPQTPAGLSRFFVYDPGLVCPKAVTANKPSTKLNVNPQHVISIRSPFPSSPPKSKWHLHTCGQPGPPSSIFYVDTSLTEGAGACYVPSHPCSPTLPPRYQSCGSW